MAFQAGLDPALLRRVGRMQTIQRSVAIPSRRGPLKLVALHRSAVTSQSFFSRSVAAITSRRMVPLPIN